MRSTCSSGAKRLPLRRTAEEEAEAEEEEDPPAGWDGGATPFAKEEETGAVPETEEDAWW